MKKPTDPITFDPFTSVQRDIQVFGDLSVIQGWVTRLEEADTLDGSKILRSPPGVLKPVVNTGINYQPQTG